MILTQLLYPLPDHVKDEKPSVLVCYGDMDVGTIKNYDIVVIESFYYSADEVQQLKKQNKKVLGYISLTEVNKAAWFYNELEPYTIEANTIWNSKYIDISKKEAVKTLINVINQIYAKGFDGLFLDNVDNATIYGNHPEHEAHLIELLKKLRSVKQDAFLIQNSGLVILDKTHSFIDMVALESVITHFDFEKNTYNLREHSEYKKYLDRIDSLNIKYKVPMLFIEYANNEQLLKKTVKKLHRTDHLGFVGQIDLLKIPTFN